LSLCDSLRSCDVDFLYGQTDIAAPQLHRPGRRIPKARAVGYLPPAASQPIALPNRGDSFGRHDHNALNQGDNL
jgi:hypothetical protein